MAGVVAILITVLFWRFVLLIAAEVYQGAGVGAVPAAFEARSALTGAGYTTTQSEMVVNDPASRDAASMLFIVGYVGPLAILGLLGLSFAAPSAEDPELRATVLIVFLVLFGVLNKYGILARIGRRPARWVATHLFRAHIRSPWIVFGDHAVAGLVVAPSSPLVDRRLDQRPFDDRQVTVLGIQRDTNGSIRHLAAAAHPGEAIRAEDTVISYGATTDLSELRDLAAGRKPSDSKD
jgi:hypothetical protein